MRSATVWRSSKGLRKLRRGPLRILVVQIQHGQTRRPSFTTLCPLLSAAHHSRSVTLQLNEAQQVIHRYEEVAKGTSARVAALQHSLEIAEQEMVSRE